MPIIIGRYSTKSSASRAAKSYSSKYFRIKIEKSGVNWILSVIRKRQK